MTIASSVGADVFPVISGQFMEDYPMTLMYLTASTIILCSTMFLSAIFIGGKIRHEKEQSTAAVISEEDELKVKLNKSGLH